MHTLAAALVEVFPDARLRYHACVRKQPYPTEDDARRAQLRRRRLSGVPIGIYQCPWANHFHLTSHAAEPTPEDLQAELQALMRRFQVRVVQMTQLEAKFRLRHVCKISFANEGSS